MQTAAQSNARRLTAEIKCKGPSVPEPKTLKGVYDVRATGNLETSNTRQRGECGNGADLADAQKGGLRNAPPRAVWQEKKLPRDEVSITTQPVDGRQGGPERAGREKGPGMTPTWPLRTSLLNILPAREKKNR